jgi:hypothetical protein
MLLKKLLMLIVLLAQIARPFLPIALSPFFRVPTTPPTAPLAEAAP